MSVPVRVRAARPAADRMRTLVLEPTGDGPLPAWQPGAHVDLLLPDGTVRQQSLCGDPADRTSYRVGVLREVDGGRGSAWVHDACTARCG